MLDPDWQALVAHVAKSEAPHLVDVAKSEGLLREDALDAVQDALATLLRFAAADRIAADRDELRRYLVALVRNHARNARRRHHRARPHEPLELPTSDTPESLMLTLEALERTAGCMSTLSLVQRHVIELRVLEELAAAEVAARLELAPGHVAVLLHRARAALARCLADESTPPL